MVNVARIVRSQGKRGELRLRFYEIKPADLKAPPVVFVGKEGVLKRYEVESFSPKGKDADLKLRGVDSLSQADGLAGKEVYLPRESLKRPEAGSYYVFDLVGCSVVTREGEVIGRVRDVDPGGAGDLLVVEAGGGKEILIPFQESICLAVDLEKKVILIDPPEGLLELNEI